MQKTATADAPAPGAHLGAARAATFPILVALGASHLLNDLMQSLIPALYPMLKAQLHLDFGQIGLITLAFMLTASLLQPSIGLYTDRHPMPYSLAVGMGSTLCGLLLLSVAADYFTVLVAASLVGTGSAVFHPEASRVVRMAAGGRYGLAQAIFQVGGNLGGAVGPLLAALIGMTVLARVGMWYAAHPRKLPAAAAGAKPPVPGKAAIFVLTVLMLLVFSKNVYSTSLSTYLTFYLIERFGLAVRDAQVQLFIYMAAIAIGTLTGGAISDRIGRRPMIWISVLGALPFTLLLPHANLFWTAVLTVVIGMLMASTFPAILVYAHEVLPGRVGMVSGLFFGLSFGLGGLGAAVLGKVADAQGIFFVYHVCAWLPAIGLVAWFLPNLEGKGRSHGH